METVKSKEAVGDLVQARLKGRSVRGVTFSVDTGLIYLQEDYWRVPVIPSEEPDRLMATYEELAILEEELQGEGHKITLSLGEPAFEKAA